LSLDRTVARKKLAAFCLCWAPKSAFRIDFGDLWAIFSRSAVAERKTRSKHYWQTTDADPGDRILGMTSMRTRRPFLQYGQRCTSKLQMRFNRSSVVSCGFMIILPASFTRSLQNLVL
jgi:hypothetical protein